MLKAFELDPATESVYLAIISKPGSDISALAAELGYPENTVRAAIGDLAEVSLLRPCSETPGELRAVSPDIALEALLASQEAELARRQAEIAKSRAVIAMSAAEGSRHRRVGVEIEQIDGIDEIRDRLQVLARQSRDEVLALMPGGGQSEANLAASKAIDEELLERGVGILTLYLDSMRNHPLTAGYARWMTELGGEVRTLPTLPIRMIVFDRELALIPTDPDNTGKGVLLTRDRGTVTALTALFDHLWSAAQPFGAPVRKGDDGLTGQERDLLRLLAAGYTDLIVARELGVSPRTARRITADLMERLSARSRFQAGARAAERGWLSPSH
ncbi:LuxR C-terminal-related transcriptional regulator [Embleya sp. NPDC005575]|uniref:LuxR C-terminal-related transcriptional regulator n=1 Tax=Embleya sp. NPDC005575 TaxID=3156892 RepID=UPI0033B7CE25